MAVRCATNGPSSQDAEKVRLAEELGQDGSNRPENGWTCPSLKKSSDRIRNEFLHDEAMDSILSSLPGLAASNRQMRRIVCVTARRRRIPASRSTFRRLLREESRCAAHQLHRGPQAPIPRPAGDGSLPAEPSAARSICQPLSCDGATPSSRATLARAAPGSVSRAAACSRNRWRSGGGATGSYAIPWSRETGNVQSGIRWQGHGWPTMPRRGVTAAIRCSSASCAEPYRPTGTAGRVSPDTPGSRMRGCGAPGPGTSWLAACERGRPARPQTRRRSAVRAPPGHLPRYRR